MSWDCQVRASGNLDGVDQMLANRCCGGGLSLRAPFDRLRANGDVKGLPRWSRMDKVSTHVRAAGVDD